MIIELFSITHKWKSRLSEICKKKYLDEAEINIQSCVFDTSNYTTELCGWVVMFYRQSDIFPVYPIR